MSWITIISNPNNGYCGFDRSYSVLEKVKIDSTFNIIEDYIIADCNIKRILDYYNSNQLNLKNNKLICISDKEISSIDFKFIGFDCGYFFDKYDDFYIGFSSIANEVIRMNNSFCCKYRNKLNDYLLFQSIEEVLCFKKERENILKRNIYHFEDAFEDFVIMYIYLLER